MSVTAGYKVDQRFTFFAVSTDTLPTMWSGQPMPIGSEVYLTDVNQRLAWTGSAWVNLEDVVEESPVYNPPLTTINDTETQVLSLLGQILAQLQLLNASVGNNPSDAPLDLNTSNSTLTQTQ